MLPAPAWPGPPLPVLPTGGVLVRRIVQPRWAGLADRRLDAHAAARDILAACLGADPANLAVRHPPGRPPDAGVPGWALSLTYGDGFALVAVAHADQVGIDATAIALPEEWETLSEAWFAPATATAIRAADAATRPMCFAAAWAAHEAVGKLSGLGLAAPRDAKTRLFAVAAPAGWCARLALG